MKANFQLATLYGEGNGNPPVTFPLRNAMDRTWQAIVSRNARVRHN